MNRTLRQRRFLLWLLISVMGLAAFAPGIARAVTAWGVIHEPWQVVCLSPAAERGKPLSAPAVGEPGDTCAYCQLRTDLDAALPSGRLTLAAPVFTQAVPRLFLRAPQPLFAWHQAQPRAPPSAA